MSYSLPSPLVFEYLAPIQERYTHVHSAWETRREKDRDREQGGKDHSLLLLPQGGDKITTMDILLSGSSHMVSPTFKRGLEMRSLSKKLRAMKKKKKVEFSDGHLFNLAMMGHHNLIPLCQGLTDESH